MSQDRDTHFLGFAELLASEIETLDNEIVPGTNDMSLSYGHWKERVRLIIARRAYDLVEHTIDGLWLYINDDAVEPTPSDIPDLTQWPESPTPRLESPSALPDGITVQAPSDDQPL